MSKEKPLVPATPAAQPPDVNKIKLELGKIHGDLPGLYDRARSILDKGRTALLISRHTLGQVLQQAYKVGAKHGSSVLATALGISPDEVRHTRLFAERYTREQLDQLLAQCSTEKAIDWAHVRLLLSIDDPKKREAAQKMVVQRKWTVQELSAHIQEKFGKRSGGGRPVTARTPTSLFGATKQLTAMLEKMRVQADALFGDEQADSCALFELLDSTPPDKITEDVEVRVSKMADELTEMVEHSTTYLERCEQALERIRDAKQRAEEAAEEAEDGSDVENGDPVPVHG